MTSATSVLAHAGHAGHGPAWPGVVALLLLAAVVLVVGSRRSGARRGGAGQAPVQPTACSVASATSKRRPVCTASSYAASPSSTPGTSAASGLELVDPA